MLCPRAGALWGWELQSTAGQPEQEHSPGDVSNSPGSHPAGVGRGGDTPESPNKEGYDFETISKK